MQNENTNIPPLQEYDINLEDIIVDVVRDNRELQGRVTLVNEFDPNVPTVVGVNFIRKVLHRVYWNIVQQTVDRESLMDRESLIHVPEVAPTPVTAPIAPDTPKESHVADEPVVPSPVDVSANPPGTHLGWRRIGH